MNTYAPQSVTVDSKTGFPAELPAPGGKVSVKVTDIDGAGITPTQERSSSTRRLSRCSLV